VGPTGILPVECETKAEATASIYELRPFLCCRFNASALQRPKVPVLFPRFVFRFLPFAGAIVFLLGGGEGFLEADHVLAGAQSIESFGFFA